MTALRLRLFSGDCAPAVESVPAEVAERLFHREAFRKLPSGTTLEPFSRDWFERIHDQRYARHGQWMPRVLEFARHRGDIVMCLGEGLGTDWLQYARHGADVITLCASHEQLDLIRTHFEHCGQFARFLHGSPQHLPVMSDSVDVVCVQGLLHELDDPAPVVDEVYRVLRPGGKVIAVAPAKFNASFWYNASYPWRHWFGYPRGERMPAATTGRAMRQAFSQFVDHKVSKRHLRRGEMPHLWRWLPLTAMERVVGNLLVLKAFKPLSAAIRVAQAA